MSSVEKATGELQAMVAGVNKAQETAGAADANAQEVAARAAGSGFVGIAAGMSRVREVIAGVRGELAATGNVINEAAARAAAAPKEATPEQTVAALSSAADRVTAVQDGISRAINKVDEAQRLVVTILHGGQPGPMLALLRTVKEILLLVAQRCGTAGQHLATATSEARQIGDLGN